MQIKIDYDAHPDMGGQQKIYQINNGQQIEIDPHLLVGKKIQTIELYKDELHITFYDDEEPDSLLAKLEEVSSNLLNAEQDLERFKAILNGDWPDSEKILEQALENTRNKSFFKKLKKCLGKD